MCGSLSWAPRQSVCAHRGGASWLGASWRVRLWCHGIRRAPTGASFSYLAYKFGLQQRSFSDWSIPAVYGLIKKFHKNLNFLSCFFFKIYFLLYFNFAVFLFVFYFFMSGMEMFGDNSFSSPCNTLGFLQKNNSLEEKGRLAGQKNLLSCDNSDRDARFRRTETDFSNLFARGEETTLPLSQIFLKKHQHYYCCYYNSGVLNMAFLTYNREERLHLSVCHLCVCPLFAW